MHQWFFATWRPCLLRGAAVALAWFAIAGARAQDAPEFVYLDAYRMQTGAQETGMAHY